MLELRGYQREAVGHVLDRLVDGQFRTCMQAPCGAGKTLIFTELLKAPVPQVLLTSRRLLVEQTARVCKQQGVPFSFRASGYKYDPDCRVQLGMIQTEGKRHKGQPHPGTMLVHVDELHLHTGPGIRKILDDYHRLGASIVGWTATPTRLRGLVDSVHEVTTHEKLLADGLLTPYKAFAPDIPSAELEATLKRAADGEFSPSSAEKYVRPKVLFGRVVNWYEKLARPGVPFILFAHDVKSSLWWAQRMTAHGIPTAHVDGGNVWVNGRSYDNNKGKRDEVIAMVRSGELAGLCNRYVLRTGLDIPEVGHLILACPFGRRAGFVQTCGRAMRPHENREFSVIADHCGNLDRHPAPDSDVKWNWEDEKGIDERVHVAKMESGEVPEPITCPECCFVRYTGAGCPNCGKRYEKHSRYVLETDGSLSLVHGRRYKPRKTEVKKGDAETWERLFWAARKNKPKRTPEQIYSYYAYSNGWRWLDRSLPLMPRSAEGWRQPVGSLPFDSLIGGENYAGR